MDSPLFVFAYQVVIVYRKLNHVLTISQRYVVRELVEDMHQFLCNQISHPLFYNMIYSSMLFCCFIHSFTLHSMVLFLTLIMSSFHTQYKQ